MFNFPFSLVSLLASTRIVEIPKFNSINIKSLELAMLISICVVKWMINMVK